jgi:hypothetical protein
MLAIVIDGMPRDRLRSAIIKSITGHRKRFGHATLFERICVVTGLEVPPTIDKLRRFAMKYLDHQQSEIDRQRWEAYKQLELVSDPIDNSDRHRGGFKFGIDLVWRTLLGLLVDELVTEQQIDYLDRCWGANEDDRSPSKTLQRFLTLIG